MPKNDHRERAAWPPGCEYGGCENPGDGSPPIVVDYGTRGRRPTRVCGEHRDRLATTKRKRAA